MIMAIISATVVYAQDAAELARQQQELNKVLMKSLNTKPTKDAKKEAKRLKKAGWIIPAGERSIEQQITTGHILGAELMVDENGAPTRRFIQHTGIATAGTYNVAYASARSNSQVEIATMIANEIVAAMAGKLDNAQQNAENAVSVEKFNQRIKSLVHETLTNSIPVLTIYRVLDNKNFEVQVRIAFDKKEVAAKVKRNMQKELEMEGDQLNEIVDQAINTAIQ